MKKILLILGLAFIIIANVEAAPTAPTFLPDLADTGIYVIEDQSNPNDVFDAAHGGYYNNSGDGDDTDNFTGFYIGTITNDNNDSQTDIQNLINLFLTDAIFEITEFGKYDVDGDGNSGDNDIDLTISYTLYNDDNEAIAGEWEIANNNTGLEISFYSVKGSDEYALYYVDPAAATGLWTTGHLLNGGGINNPGISHFSGAIILETTPDDPPNVVPEPATMLLLGFGLIGLAGIGRRNRKI